GSECLLDHALWAACRLPCGGIPRTHSVHIGISAVSHRQRGFRWPAAGNRREPLRLDWQHLCGPDLSDRGCVIDLCCGHGFPEGESRDTDLGRGVEREEGELARPCVAGSFGICGIECAELEIPRRFRRAIPLSG